MKPETIAIAGIFVAFVLAEFIAHGFFNKKGEKKGDGWIDTISATVLALVTQPLAFAGGFGLATLLSGGQDTLLAGLPIWGAIIVMILFEDLTQYWWHRASHTFPWLYKLHRPHHNAEYLSVRIVFRNNIFYYGLMPGLWLGGALVALGLNPLVYASYMVIKQLIVIGAHSDVKWDEPLYRIKWLSPIMWVVERTISTPSTHHAHHGKHQADGVTNYKGNYGNLLFFWDVLFGTAKITRGYPPEYGVENLPETTPAEQLLWPVIRSTPSIASIQRGPAE